MYDVRLTKRAAKDYDLLERAGLAGKRGEFISISETDPLRNPPEYEALKGDKKGAYSRRINKKHRFVFEVLPSDENSVDETGEPYEGIVKIISMWTHYEKI